MEWVETAGRTLADAKDAALDQLGVDETDAEFVVLSEPKAGLFGRTRGEARVRARVKPTQPRPKRGRERRPASGRKRGGGGEGHQGPAVTVGAGGSRAAQKMEGDGEARSERGDGRTAEGVDDEAKPRRRRGGQRGGGQGRASQGGGRSAGSQDGGRNGEPSEPVPAPARAGRGKDKVETGGASANGAARKAHETEEEAAVAEMTLEEQGEAARQFVADLVETLGVSASVQVRPTDEDTVSVAVEGDGVGTLVGPGGTTLAALQELTRTYVQKITGGQSDRILVDVAGYRARRVAALQRFTQGVAEEVLASGEPRALEPMSAADRKVVHDAVNEIDGVATRSEGEDPRRYIVLVPVAAES